VFGFTICPIQFKADLVGKCTFEQDKYRGAKNCFSAEKSVLLSKINDTDLLLFCKKYQAIYQVLKTQITA
jgi:CRISPR/Cas system Type II protein with McrA/HNH and RuvC-like nuclease domain